MEESGQYYSQCVEEARAYQRLFASIRTFTGPIAILTVNTEGIQRTVAGRCDVEGEFGGRTTSVNIILN